MSPFSFLILFIWILSLCPLVSLPKDLSILLIWSKNQLLVLLILCIVSSIFFNLVDFRPEFHDFVMCTSLACICFFWFWIFLMCYYTTSICSLQFVFGGIQICELYYLHCFRGVPLVWVCCVFIFIKFPWVFYFFISSWTSFHLEGYSSASKLCSPYVGFVVAVVVVVAAAAAVAVAAIEDQFELDMIF